MRRSSIILCGLSFPRAASLRRCRLDSRVRRKVDAEPDDDGSCWKVKLGLALGPDCFVGVSSSKTRQFVRAVFLVVCWRAGLSQHTPERDRLLPPQSVEMWVVQVGPMMEEQVDGHSPGVDDIK